MDSKNPRHDMVIISMMVLAIVGMFVSYGEKINMRDFLPYLIISCLLFAVFALLWELLKGVTRKIVKEEGEKKGEKEE